MTWLLTGAVSVAAAAFLGVAVWLAWRELHRKPPGAPIVKGGVLHELLLAAPIRLWALILAGPPLTLFAAWIVWLVRYGWPAGTEHQRLEILGMGLYGTLGLLAIVMVSLAAVKLEAETRLGKLSIGRDDDDETPPKVEVTTTVTAQPAASEADADPTMYGGPRT